MYGGYLGDKEGIGLKGVVHPRCHPGATLIRNSSLFQELATRIGFSPFLALAADNEMAGYWDTLGVSSAAMAATGLRYGLSALSVHHFFLASYDKVHVAAREADARRRLRRFASDGSSTLEETGR